MQSRLYAHFILFKNSITSNSVRLSLSVPFRILGGQYPYGWAAQNSLLLPSACPHEYLVTYGFEGLPYTGELGPAGTAVCTFMQPSAGIYVVTYGETMPGYTVVSQLYITQVLANVGSGNAVTRATVSCGGVSSIVQWAGGQPIEGFRADYPVDSLWLGPRPGYTLISSTIAPLQ